MSKLTDVTPNKTPTHMVRSAGLTLSREARQSMGKYVEREKQKGEAPAPDNNLWDRTTTAPATATTPPRCPAPAAWSPIRCPAGACAHE